MLPVDFNLFLPDNMIDASIILPSGEPVRIDKFHKMNLDFSNILKAYTNEDNISSRIVEENCSSINYEIKLSFNQQIKLAELFGDSHNNPGFSLNLTKQTKVRINGVIFPCSITAAGKNLVSRAVKFDPTSIPRIILKIVLNKEVLSLIPKIDDTKYISGVISSSLADVNELKKDIDNSYVTIADLNRKLKKDDEEMSILKEQNKKYEKNIEDLENRIESLKKIRNKYGMLDV